MTWLQPYFSQDIAKVKPKYVSEILMQAYEKYREDQHHTDGIISTILIRFLEESWTEYLYIMGLEKENAKSLFLNKPKRRKQHMISCSKNLCETLIEKSVLKAVSVQVRVAYK